VGRGAGPMGAAFAVSGCAMWAAGSQVALCPSSVPRTMVLGRRAMCHGLGPGGQEQGCSEHPEVFRGEGSCVLPEKPHSQPPPSRPLQVTFPGAHWS